MKARLLRRVDNQPVWSISCFYIRRSHRKKRVMTMLIRAAMKMARHAQAPALEAYPVDKRVANSSSNIFTGVASTFTRVGFKVVARRATDRPIMRYGFKIARKTKGTH